MTAVSSVTISKVPVGLSAPLHLGDPSHTRLRALLLGQGPRRAQSYKVEENTAFDLSNFPSAALVFRTTPQGSGVVPDYPRPPQVLKGGIGDRVLAEKFSVVCGRFFKKGWEMNGE